MTIPPVKTLLDFSRKVVVVTGSSRGIGAGIARRFAEAGAAVVVNYRQDQAAARMVVSTIKQAGGEAIAVQADVTKRSDLERLAHQTLAVFSGLDVVINNAGIYPLVPLLDMTEAAWDLVINTNLKSVFISTQVMANKMIERQVGGVIINIASIEGGVPAPLHSHYNTAKSGVLMHTRAAAAELGAQGIRVNAVSPGLIWREGLERDWSEGVTRYEKAAPLKCLGQSEDVADACLFLASPAARWITGVNLWVDGGMMMANTPYG